MRYLFAIVGWLSVLVAALMTILRNMSGMGPSNNAGYALLAIMLLGGLILVGIGSILGQLKRMADRP